MLSFWEKLMGCTQTRSDPFHSFSHSLRFRFFLLHSGSEVRLFEKLKWGKMWTERKLSMNATHTCRPRCECYNKRAHSVSCAKQNDERMKYPKRKLQSFEKLKNVSFLSARILFFFRFHVGGVECIGGKVNETSAEFRNPKTKKNLCEADERVGKRK